MIWYEVFWKLRVSFDRMVTSKKVFSESSHCTETHIFVVVDILEVQNSVYLDFCIDDEFIEFWLTDLMFQNSYATNCCRLYTIQWYRPHVSRYHSGRVRRLWWIFLGWWGFQSVNTIRDFFEALILRLLWASSFSHQSLDCLLSSISCWIKLWGAWWLNVYQNFYLWHIQAWGIKNQYNGNRAMIMIYCYKAKISINEQINW